MRNRVSEHNLRFYVNIMLKLYNTLGDCCFIFIFISHLSLQFCCTFIFIFFFSFFFRHRIMWYLSIVALKSWPVLLHLPQKIKCFSGTKLFVRFIVCLRNVISSFCEIFKSNYVKSILYFAWQSRNISSCETAVIDAEKRGWAALFACYFLFRKFSIFSQNFIWRQTYSLLLH